MSNNNWKLRKTNDEKYKGDLPAFKMKNCLDDTRADLCQSLDTIQETLDWLKGVLKTIPKGDNWHKKYSDQITKLENFLNDKRV